MDADSGSTWQELAETWLDSVPGNERRAMDWAAEVIAPLGLPDAQINRVKTAVAEATMNAMEHGHQYQPGRLVRIRVRLNPNVLLFEITDRTQVETIPDPVTPNLEAKLSGQQSPRGWGLFLIQSMVDELRQYREGELHVMELIFKRMEQAQGG